MTTTEITEELKRAILSAGSTRQGAQVHASDQVCHALFLAGLVGRNLGLTRKGSILAGRLRREAEDAAFGGVA